MGNEITVMRHGEVLAPDTAELRMPRGVPLGLAFLGVARFRAIRLVLEEATRSAYALADYHGAQAAVVHSRVRLEAARTQLLYLDDIRAQTASQVAAGTWSARAAELEQRLQVMELEDRIAEREAARTPKSHSPQPAPVASQQVQVARPDKFEEVFAFLARIPELAQAATRAKERIVADTTGEIGDDNSKKDMLEMVDTITAAAMQKQIGESIL
jgi:hypothetical protein